jgi:hypothetical protein
MNRPSTVGRKRLAIVLGTLSGVACAFTMLLVLIFYGAPYNPLWWWVMGAILLGAFVLPSLLARPVEWIMEGYEKDD